MLANLLAIFPFQDLVATTCMAIKTPCLEDMVEDR